MKNGKLLIIPIFALALLLSLGKITAHAEEVKTQTVKYHNENTFTSGNTLKSTWDYEWEVSGYSLYAYTQDADTIYFVAIGDTSRTVRIKDIGTVVHEMKNGTIVNSNIGTVDMYVHTVEEINANTDPNYDYRSYNVQYNQNWQLEGVPLFDSISSLRAYVNNGDESGWLNKPEFNYEHEHNFSNDVYNVDIPLPELSQISHNGFVVDNIEGYYIDVAMYTKFYGITLSNSNPQQDFGYMGGLADYLYDVDVAARVDKSWLYKSRSYDFSLDDRAFNNTTININELYGIDNVNLYLEEFKLWSEEYPTIKQLPSYKWIYTGADYPFCFSDNELNKHNGNVESYLRSLGQCETIYYVRFYDENMNYGQWAQYTYGATLSYDGVLNQPVYNGSLNSGAVSGSTVDGKPIVNDTVGGYVDDNGNISYRPNDTIYVDADMNMSNFKDTVTSLVDGVRDFPQFISDLFSFLPGWLVGMIAFAIAAVVLLRFLGR